MLSLKTGVSCSQKVDAVLHAPRTEGCPISSDYIVSTPFLPNLQPPSFAQLAVSTNPTLSYTRCISQPN